MIRFNPAFLLFLTLFACQPQEKHTLNEQTLASMGNKFKTDYVRAAGNYEDLILEDSTNIEALLGLVETQVMLYIFGYMPREETLPKAHWAFQKTRSIDSTSAGIHTFAGILSLLDWDWNASRTAFLKAINADPQDPKPRHWYSLWLSAMGRFEEAMAQSDSIMSVDASGDYQVGRGSLLYFARRNAEMKDLMLETVARDTTVPWGYDWLGMSYIELKEYDNSIDTYFKAFELSDGTVEVGAGLGHALGLAGRYDTAKQMADYYTLAAKDHYLPPVQRSFVHIGIGEYEEAITLLEQAYEEHSWFLVFIQVEPWYDPIRKDKRFADIIGRMEFPETL